MVERGIILTHLQRSTQGGFGGSPRDLERNVEVKAPPGCWISRWIVGPIEAYFHPHVNIQGVLNDGTTHLLPLFNWSEYEGLARIMGRRGASPYSDPNPPATISMGVAEGGFFATLHGRCVLIPMSSRMLKHALNVVYN
jgi:hypothetical protein